MAWAKTRLGGEQLSLVDGVERVFLFLLLGSFLARLVPSLNAQPYNILMLISESFTVCLVLLRKPGPMASTAYAWTIAVVGTCAALLVTASGAAVIPVWAGASLMLAGLVVSFSAKIFLNRSYGIVAANRGVKRSGPYQLVRHPMYLGYVITHIGFLLLHLSFWNFAIYSTAWIAMVLRIRAEEDFLSRDQEYRDYAGSVRYRLVPGLF